MLVARFKMPDGRIGRFEVPDGTTPEQAQAMIQDWIGKGETRSAPSPKDVGKDAFPNALRKELQDAGWIDRNLAAFGTAATNAGEGISQLVKGSELYNLVAKSRLAMPGDGVAPANKNTQIIREAAPVGAFAGDFGLSATPLGVAGSSPAMVGGVMSALGAIQPVENEKDRVLNSAVSGVLGAGGQVVANKAGQAIANKRAELIALKSRNAPMDQTIKEALDAGYVIPPGQINPSFKNRRLESMGGKIATQQMAATKNQEVTDSLARKAAGLMPDDPITPESLRAARDVIKKPYVDIANLGLQPKLDALDAARAEATAAWREYGRQGTRSALNDYKTFSTQAKNIEREIESDLMKSGKPELFKAFKSARVALAKNHDVESALIEGGGTIDARAIGRMFQRGDKLTDELATIGKFANNFRKDVQPGASMGTPDSHNLQHVMSLLMGGGGAAAMGPLGVMAGAVPLVSGPAARAIMFSGPAQRGLLSSYQVPVSSRVGAGLLGYSPVGGAVLGMNALNQ